MPAPSGLVQQQNQFNQFFSGLRASLQTREEDIRIAKIQNLMNFLEEKEQKRHDLAVQKTKEQQELVKQIALIVGGVGVGIAGAAGAAAGAGAGAGVGQTAAFAGAAPTGVFSASSGFTSPDFLRLLSTVGG